MSYNNLLYLIKKVLNCLANKKYYILLFRNYNLTNFVYKVRIQNRIHIYLKYNDFHYRISLFPFQKDIQYIIYDIFNKSHVGENYIYKYGNSLNKYKKEIIKEIDRLDRVVFKIKSNKVIIYTYCYCYNDICYCVEPRKKEEEFDFSFNISNLDINICCYLINKSF